MKIDVTPAQLKNLMNLVNDVEMMIGGEGCEHDRYLSRYIDSFDRMLKRNGLPPRELDGRRIEY